MRSESGLKRGMPTYRPLLEKSCAESDNFSEQIRERKKPIDAFLLNRIWSTLCAISRTPLENAKLRGSSLRMAGRVSPERRIARSRSQGEDQSAGIIR